MIRSPMLTPFFLFFTCERPFTFESRRESLVGEVNSHKYTNLHMANLKRTNGVRSHDILPQQSDLNVAVGFRSLLRPVHITFFL